MTLWERTGETDAVERVRGQVASGEVAHAWLLIGPRGGSKSATAVAIAAALNCPEQPGTGCGRCATCLRIARHRHPDVHHVAPEGPVIPVDIVRDRVLSEAVRSRFEGRCKVFIIEEAEKMNPAAQNALLKTLEEPLDDTVFILVTDDPDSLLDTIRSRCRVVALEAMSEGDIASALGDQGAAQEVASLVARLAEGDVQRAQAFAFDAAVAERRRVWTGIPRRLARPLDALGIAAEILDHARGAVQAKELEQKSEVVELADAMGEGRGTASAKNALATRHKRELRRVEQEVLGEALHSLASFYRDVLAVRSGAVEAVVNLDLVGELESWSVSSIPDTNLVRAAERCAQGRAALALNANQLLTMEAVLVELVRLAPAPARVAAG